MVCRDRPFPTFLQCGLFTAPSGFSLVSCSIISKFSWLFMSSMTPSLFFFPLPYLFGETVWPLGGKTLCAVERAIDEEARGLGGGPVVSWISCETGGGHLPSLPSLICEVGLVIPPMELYHVVAVTECYLLDQRFSIFVSQEFLKYANPDYLFRDTDLFPLRLSNKKLTTANTASHLV